MHIILHYKYIYVVFLILIYSSSIAAQTQKIKGLVLDTNTNQPVPNVTVELLNFFPIKIAETGVDGKFVMKGVPLGKHKLLFRKKGYVDATLNGLRLNEQGAVKIVQALRKIQKNVRDGLTLSEILRQEFYAKKEQEKNKKKATFRISEDSLIQLDYYDVSPQTQYLAIGNRQDPVRFLTNNPSVLSLSDRQPALVIRGASPLALQWRLEGLPIESPLHLRTAKTSLAGSAGIFSLHSLGKSSLLLGALSADYGNAIEGVVDLNLRRTTTQRQISFLLEYSTASGVGLSIQGPLTREKHGSFVINYRYSSYNIAQSAIEKAANLYHITASPTTTPALQDVSFKLNLPSPTTDQITLFGLINISQQKLFGHDYALASRVDRLKYGENEYYTSNYFLAGLSYLKKWGTKNTNFWKTVVGATYFAVSDLSEKELLNQKKIPLSSQEDWNYSWKLNSKIQQVINSKLIVRAGLLVDYQYHSFYDIFYTYQGHEKYRFDLKSKTILTQIYAQAQYKLMSTLKLRIGFNSNFWVVGKQLKEIALEPRFALEWQEQKHKLNLGYGWHSQKLPTALLYEKQIKQKQTYWLVNTHLKTPKVHQLFLGYQFSLNANWRFKLNAYYSYQTNLVVDSLYPYINTSHYGSRYDNYKVLKPSRLMNLGSQHKIGADVMIEKYFGRDFYGFMSLSFVNVLKSQKETPSEFGSPDFGGAITSKTVIGKEFRIGPIRRNKLRIETKLVYSRDASALAVDTLASMQQQQTVYNYAEGFVQKMPHYWRLDIRVAFQLSPRKNENIIHTLAVEFLNIANVKNISGSYYSPATQNIQYNYQLPIYLDLLYRVSF